MNLNLYSQLLETYTQGVYNESDLPEEDLQSIEEWVSALIKEGYDLDEYSDEELYEAYLDEVKGGGFIKPTGTTYSTSKTLGHQSPAQKRREERSPDRRSSYSRGSQEKVPSRGSWGEPSSDHGTDSGLAMSPQKRMETRAKALAARGEGKRANKIRSVMSRPPMNEEVDIYDLVSEYLVSEGFCDSYEDADVIMANMSEEWRESILDEAVKGSGRSIADRITGNDIRSVKRGDKNVYKKPKWQDRVETDVRRDMGKEGHKNPYQYGSGATKQAKASVNRMNAEKNVEVKHDYDSDDSIETISNKSLSGYRTVPTDYRARRRRAKGL